MPLPQSPSVVGIAYKVFTRAQSTVWQIIDDSDVAKLQASGYNRTKTTAILVHGFNGKQSLPADVFTVFSFLQQAKRMLTLYYETVYC